ncbi:hypothetical protein [Halosegnis marinus]|uniref:DUF202 domain-containing protein n=1 Tax=Halosegnis marinus TaxID=3034023 RepID=A0ABD5ZMB8_9EURY|nr:hypothetical protein [Halosegnis sp. DT85]
MSGPTLREVVHEVGLRVRGAIVVLGTFLALGHAARADVLGLSGLLGGPAFLVAAFLLVFSAALGWVALRRYVG